MTNWYKKCFKCKLYLPLFMFKKRTGTYTRPSDKGRVFCCRICRLRNALKEPVVVKVDDKLQVVRLTKMEAIKEFFN